MQTFLPYSNFYESAKVLDQKRLGKQRVEVLQLLNSIKASKEDRPYKGWKNHPCRKMWYMGPDYDYANALVEYGLDVCIAWKERGYKDTCFDKIAAHYDSNKAIEYPEWLGREDIHQSHRSMLIQKEKSWYRDLWPTEKDNLEYIWPNL